MSKFYGESEARLREIFKEAKEKAPSIILSWMKLIRLLQSGKK